MVAVDPVAQPELDSVRYAVLTRAIGMKKMSIIGSLRILTKVFCIPSFSPVGTQGHLEQWRSQGASQRLASVRVMADANGITSFLSDADRERLSGIVAAPLSLPNMLLRRTARRNNCLKPFDVRLCDFNLDTLPHVATSYAHRNSGNPKSGSICLDQSTRLSAPCFCKPYFQFLGKIK